MAYRYSAYSRNPKGQFVEVDDLSYSLEDGNSFTPDLYAVGVSADYGKTLPRNAEKDERDAWLSPDTYVHGMARHLLRVNLSDGLELSKIKKELARTAGTKLSQAFSEGRPVLPQSAVVDIVGGPSPRVIFVPVTKEGKSAADMRLVKAQLAELAKLFLRTGAESIAITPLGSEGGGLQYYGQDGVLAAIRKAFQPAVDQGKTVYVMKANESGEFPQGVGGALARSLEKYNPEHHLEVLAIRARNRAAKDQLAVEGIVVSEGEAAKEYNPLIYKYVDQKAARVPAGYVRILFEEPKDWQHVLVDRLESTGSYSSVNDPAFKETVDDLFVQYKKKYGQNLSKAVKSLKEKEVGKGPSTSPVPGIDSYSEALAIKDDPDASDDLKKQAELYIFLTTPSTRRLKSIRRGVLERERVISAEQLVRSAKDRVSNARKTVAEINEELKSYNAEDPAYIASVRKRYVDRYLQRALADVDKAKADLASAGTRASDRTIKGLQAALKEAEGRLASEAPKAEREADAAIQRGSQTAKQRLSVAQGEYNDALDALEKAESALLSAQKGAAAYGTASKVLSAATVRRERATPEEIAAGAFATTKEATVAALSARVGELEDAIKTQKEHIEDLVAGDAPSQMLLAAQQSLSDLKKQLRDTNSQLQRTSKRRASKGAFYGAVQMDPAERERALRQTILEDDPTLSPDEVEARVQASLAGLRERGRISNPRGYGHAHRYGRRHNPAFSPRDRAAEGAKYSEIQRQISSLQAQEADLTSQIPGFQEEAQLRGRPVDNIPAYRELKKDLTFAQNEIARLTAELASIENPETYTQRYQTYVDSLASKASAAYREYQRQIKLLFGSSYSKYSDTIDNTEFSAGTDIEITVAERMLIEYFGQFRQADFATENLREALKAKELDLLKARELEHALESFDPRQKQRANFSQGPIVDLLRENQVDPGDKDWLEVYKEARKNSSKISKKIGGLQDKIKLEQRAFTAAERFASATGITRTPQDPAATPVIYISLTDASGRYSDKGIVTLAEAAIAVLSQGEEARRAYIALNKEQLGANRSVFSGDREVPEYARVGRQSGIGPDPRTPEEIAAAEEAAKREAKKAKMSPAQRVAATKKDADADLRKEFGIQELGPNPTIEEQQAYLESVRSARSLKNKGFTSFADADAAGAYDAKAANKSRFEAKYGISFQDAVVQNLGKYRSPAELKRALREKSPVYQQQRLDQAAAQAKIGLEKALAEIADFAKSRNLDPATVLTNQSLLLEAARESGDIRSLEDTQRARAAAERGLSPGELARLPGPNVRRGFALTPTERFEIEETQEGTPAQRAALERERLSRMAERGITPGPEWRGKLEEARDISAISGGVRKIESLFDKMDRQLLTYEQSQLRLSEAIVPPDAYESKADKEAALDMIRKELNSIKNRLTGYYDRASKQLGYPVESLEDVERSGSTFSEGAVVRVPDVYKLYDIEIGNLESLLDSVKNTPVARQSNPGAAYSTRRQAARDRIEERRSALRSRNPGGRAGQPSECLQVFCETVGVPNPDLSGTTCDPHCESARAEAFCELICSLSPTSRDAHSLMRLNPSFTPCDWAKKAASIAKSATAGSPQDRQRAIDLVSDCVSRCVECG